MLTIGALGFATPWLLLGLIALPVLWWILRAVPPAPIRRRFPGVALLLGLNEDEKETDKTPWWLLLLRMLAVAAAIVAFAGPVLNPQERAGGTAPLLIVMDGTWADARDWPRRIERAAALIEDAERDGRTVAVVRLTDVPGEITFQTADAWAGRVVALTPQAWSPPDLAAWVAELPDGAFDTFWLSDGLDHPGRADLMTALDAQGAVMVFESPRPVLVLHPATFDEGAVKLSASRLPTGGAVSVEVSARGPDPSGIDRELARGVIEFPVAAARAEADLTVPPELRNRITRFEVAGVRSAAAVSLADDSLKRRKIALIGEGADAEGLQLLSQTHYLRQALAPSADLIDGTLTDVLLASPDVIVLADVAKLNAIETEDLLEWLDKGGLLLRFAGPRLAASDISRMDEDPLMPVRLREGGRTVGGAMSWDERKTLAPFPEGSPFQGLAVTDDVTVTAQVLAQPGPDLAERTIAALADGTPLVTRKDVGAGQVVLVHVTANAEWSSLPLSGLFVSMLERLAVSTQPALPDATELEGQVFVADMVLDAYGEAQDAGDVAGVKGEDLAAALITGPTPALPPGLYAGEDRRIALNVIGADTELAAASWPAGTVIEGLELVAERALKGWFLAAGLVLLMVDILAALWISGKLSGGLRRGVAVLALGLMLGPLLGLGGPAQAQTVEEMPLPMPTDEVEETGNLQPDDELAFEATSAVVLAHVLTGEASLDQTAKAGLQGLSLRLWERTSVEPAEAMGVNIETDELLFFPFLYWPVSASQEVPSAEAYAKLNAYLASGGMILFDTRDADVAGGGGQTPEAQALQRIAAGLDIPAIEPVPADHVLTRSFYLLKDFPGRFNTAGAWVEAAPPDAEQVEGMPFRNLNDGVTPVIIGGNDWAAAWAVDNQGVALFPVGRGFAGERQREMAYRFGINVVMYVLTGNYKSDQVHVPALLERLGQ
jgi:hypothetical protein